MEYNNNSNKFLLKVDISGIQNFIFDIPSDGASKNLKGRSFYVYVLTYFAEKFFKQNFPSQTTEIIYNGGGNLLMYLTANEKDLKNKIEDFQSYFLEKDIYPFVAYAKADDNNFDLQNKQLGKLLNQEKFKRKLNFSPFESSENIDWNGLSNQLKKSNSFTISSYDKNKFISIGKFSLTFDEQNDFSIPLKNNLLNKFPIDKDGNIIDFEEIAQKAYSRGADEKLAALKMDVDNLGKLFMNRNKGEYRKISQAIENFFSVTLYTDILKPYIEKGEIYPVFAGGDDTFIIGAWDKIFEITPCIHNAFDEAQKEWKKKIKQEDDITISAGIVIVHPRFPMIRLADKVEDTLSLAKKEGKNRIGVFGECITWEEFKRVYEMMSLLKVLVKEKGESKALLHRISSSEIGFRSLQDKINKQNKIDFPKVYRLKYYLRNAKTEENKKQLDEFFENYSEALLSDFMADKTKADKSTLTNPAIFPIAARWTELLIKNKDLK
ncbi:CRISPR-associated protein Cas10 [Dysgonamonadaceae bacterium]|nr:CRISPR-associated protein Cas10 [Dysgonamonadaceae bacterium]